MHKAGGISPLEAEIEVAQNLSPATKNANTLSIGIFLANTETPVRIMLCN